MYNTALKLINVAKTTDNVEKPRQAFVTRSSADADKSARRV